MANLAGRVSRVRRYPVKGMAGEDLAEVFVGASGVTGDRVYAFFDPTSRSDFPWVTARQWREMILLKPRFLAAPEARTAAEYRVEVETPDGAVHDVTSENFRAWLEQCTGRRVALRFSEQSMHDARPVSIISMQTVEALAGETRLALDPRRFRANFYVEWADGGAFYEDALVGRRVQAGNKVILEIVKRDPRCVVITLDPENARAAPELLTTVAKRHGGCAGVYAVVVREGIVRPGDAVLVN